MGTRFAGNPTVLEMLEISGKEIFSSENAPLLKKLVVILRGLETSMCSLLFGVLSAGGSVTITHFKRLRIHFTI